MLSPDAREVATEILRAPAGYSLDHSVLTTYSLDLEVLLALPLAVLAQSDSGVEDLLENPLLLLQALREASDRIDVFVDEAGVAVPSVRRDLYGALESSVHPVRAPRGGAFHPKVWIARFVSDGFAPLIRVAVASRNLTFDRSWDVALVSEGHPGDRMRAETQPLAGLLRGLKHMARDELGSVLEGALEGLAGEVGSTSFPAPNGFEAPVAFHALGVAEHSDGMWQPVRGAERLLGVAPFVSRGALDSLADAVSDERILVSTSGALDELSEQALERWSNTKVLMDTALEESDDDTAGRPSGLHAKLLAAESGGRVEWYIGSANLTPAALRGRNVEVMAKLEASLPSADPGSGLGIDGFLSSGFSKLCATYQRREPAQEDPELAAARYSLEQQRDALLNGDLRVRCNQVSTQQWEWELTADFQEITGVEIAAWPVTLATEHARCLSESTPWLLTTEKLTAFVAFRLNVPGSAADDLTFVRKLPSQGIPEDIRMQQVLRSLIQSPERFIAFLRALLGGLEGLVDWAETDGCGGDSGHPNSPLHGETILEDLLRAASRDPERLEIVRRVIGDLKADASQTQNIVPEDLYTIWQAVDEALRRT